MAAHLPTAMLDVAAEIAAALDQGTPIVAIESAIVSPAGEFPQNVALAREVCETMRASGVVPAIVAVADGRIVVDAGEAQLEKLGRAKALPKVGTRELASALTGGGTAATTVSATLRCAHLCNIPVAMTGAIGGVHRDYQESLDVSSDLDELARTQVAIVCMGAKILLDLPRTLEYLETKTVPVVGFRTSRFPAYFCSSGLNIERFDEPARIAALMATHWALGVETGVVVAVPPSSDLPAEAMEALVREGVEAARRDRIVGKAITPYLLKHMETATGGESERLRRSAILQVAKSAAEIAIAYAARRGVGQERSRADSVGAVL